jgi:hypothetical protein
MLFVCSVPETLDNLKEQTRNDNRDLVVCCISVPNHIAV